MLVALGHDRLARLPPDRRIVCRRFLLRANREHLDAELGEFRWRQSANFDTVEHLAQLCRNVSRAANDLVAHGDVLESAATGNSRVAVLKTTAQAFRFALASLHTRRWRSTRDQGKTRP